MALAARMSRLIVPGGDGASTSGRQGLFAGGPAPAGHASLLQNNSLRVTPGRSLLLPSRVAAVDAPRAAPYVYVPEERCHTISAKGQDVIASMSGWAESELLAYLKPVDQCWQPQDWLPEPSSPDFYDQARRAGRGGGAAVGAGGGAPPARPPPFPSSLLPSCPRRRPGRCCSAAPVGVAAAAALTRWPTQSHPPKK